MSGVPPELRDLVARFDAPGALARVQGARPPGGGRAAAVLILLSRPADDYSIVFVEKNADLRSHAGQIAFPGGTMEPGETDPVQAALREAQEEAGIDPAGVEVLGALPKAHINRSGFDVTSVVGWWNTPGPLAAGDPFEIQAVHQIDVPTLLAPETRLTWVLPNGYSGPAFVVGDLFIWGFTAYLLDAMFDLLGWTQAWDTTRTAEIPPRFFSERL
ncbi:MAG: CoA pyrophosphatase [Propionicimonas sp.]|nr:CoA pyrophosphatase [Propionicimonas sp.]